MLAVSLSLVKTIIDLQSGDELSFFNEKLRETKNICHINRTYNNVGIILISIISIFLKDN